jgi:hypothetical protein
MNWDEYNKLFHKLELNLVAFKPLMECDKEVLKLVNAAIEEEREACAKVCEAIAQEMYDQGEGPTGYVSWVNDCYLRIRARGQE